MFLTDTHAHVHMSPLNARAGEVLKKAVDQNVRRVVTIGIDLEDSTHAFELAAEYSGVYSTAGVHPHDAESFEFVQLGMFETLLSHSKVIAVGEVGLDFYRNRSSRDKQIEVFSLMADMALAAKLPLIVHTRDASTETVEVLDHIIGSREHPILFHCFNGDPMLINWGMKRKKVMFSFAGNVTYPKAVELHEALARLPLDRLFVETDCPYLTPAPHRGRENEPAYLPHTAKYVAEVKKVMPDYLAMKLEENFVAFFGEHQAGIERL